MKRVKLMVLGAAVLSLALIAGCGTQKPAATEPAKTEPPKAADTAKPAEATQTAAKPATATYVGAQTCLGCHPNETNVAKTKHNGSFKPLSAYKLAQPAGSVTVFDGANNNAKSASVDLSKALGVMMDHYVVMEVPKDAGFSKQYYRVAALEKDGDTYKVKEAALVKDKKDWSASEYTCGKCHSPGVGAPGKPDLTITCEACHGPGSAHVSAAKEDKAKTIVSPDSDTCLNCHKTDPTKDATSGAILANNHYGTRGYTFSKHAASHQTNGCFTCHKAHSTNAKGQLLRADNPNDICMTCHADKKYDVEKVMYKNPVDGHDHITADHSFGAIPLSAYKVDTAKKTMTVTDQKALDVIKAKLPALFK